MEGRGGRGDRCELGEGPRRRPAPRPPRALVSVAGHPRPQRRRTPDLQSQHMLHAQQGAGDFADVQRAAGSHSALHMKDESPSH